MVDCSESVWEVVGLGEGEVLGEVVVEESVVVGGGEEAVGLKRKRREEDELRRFCSPSKEKRESSPLGLQALLQRQLSMLLLLPSFRHLGSRPSLILFVSSSWERFEIDRRRALLERGRPIRGRVLRGR